MSSRGTAGLMICRHQCVHSSLAHKKCPTKLLGHCFIFPNTKLRREHEQSRSAHRFCNATCRANYIINRDYVQDNAHPTPKLVNIEADAVQTFYWARVLIAPESWDSSASQCERFSDLVAQRFPELSPMEDIPEVASYPLDSLFSDGRTVGENHPCSGPRPLAAHDIEKAIDWSVPFGEPLQFPDAYQDCPFLAPWRKYGVTPSSNNAADLGLRSPPQSLEPSPPVSAADAAATTLPFMADDETLAVETAPLRTVSPKSPRLPKHVLAILTPHARAYNIGSCAREDFQDNAWVSQRLPTRRDGPASGIIIARTHQFVESAKKQLNNEEVEYIFDDPNSPGRVMMFEWVSSPSASPPLHPLTHL